MTLFTIKRRCDKCEETRELLRELTEQVGAYRREVQESLLDYQSLYDKVRVNLAKLAKRTDRADNGDQAEARDPVAAARLRLLERKLGGK